MPLISFVIPVYNVASYLHECLDSVVGQDFSDFEVCIVDDGSTDGGGAICNEYAAAYPGLFKLKHQPNQGVSVARNNAIKMAIGQYIWFVDADDYILPGSLHYISEILRQSGCETLFFGNEPFVAESAMEYGMIDDRNDFLSRHACFCNPLMIFSREIIARNDIQFPVGIRMGEDLEFQYHYLIHSGRLATTPFKFYHIREREGSASRSTSSAATNYAGAWHLLDSMVSTLTPAIATANRWLEPRLAERLKALLQSALSTKVTTARELRLIFRRYLRAFRQLGFKSIGDGSLKIAKIDIRLYYTIYRIIYNIRSK